MEVASARYPWRRKLKQPGEVFARAVTGLGGARTLVAAAITGSGNARRREAANRDAQAEASWQQRALNAEHALKTAHAEVRTQRTRIGELLGQLRDARNDRDPGAAERLATENTTLKQRVRDLTAANRTLDERLQAARSNNRFLDKRIAGLEAQLGAANPAQTAE